MTNLALKSVLHDWRRYMPVMIAVGVSGLMMIVQAALTMGAVALMASPVRQASAQLWVGSAESKTLDDGRPVDPGAIGPLWIDPDVTKVEAYPGLGFSQISEGANVGTPVSLVSIETSPQGMVMARAIPPALRTQLAEPGTTVLNRTDARNNGIQLGDTINLSHQPLRVIGLLDEGQAVMGLQLVVGQATSRSLNLATNDQPSFWLMSLRPGADPKAVAERVTGTRGEYRVWQPEELSTSIIKTWLFEYGAGRLFLTSSGIALIITLMVVSQTLSAAVAGSVREYAALRAYGISFRRVQALVMRQGAWVCLGALSLTAIASVLVLAGLKARGVTVEMPLPLAGAVVAALVVVVIISNLFAVRRLRHADPALLLR